MMLIQYVELNFYVAMFEDVGYDVDFRVVLVLLCEL